MFLYNLQFNLSVLKTIAARLSQKQIYKLKGIYLRPFTVTLCRKSEFVIFKDKTDEGDYDQ